MTDDDRIEFIRWLHRPLTDEERAILQADTIARIKAQYGETPSEKQIFRVRRGELGAARRRALRPTSISRVAARYAHLWRIPIIDAANEFGLSHSTVYEAWRAMYPREPHPVRRAK